MIKITSIEIDGFIIPSQKVKLDFVESNIVCIYGNNGSGKTTFLEILFAVFDRDETILERYNVSSITLKYKIDTSEIEENIESLKQQIEYLKNKLSREYEKLESIIEEEEKEKYQEDIITPIEGNIENIEGDIEKIEDKIRNEVKLLDNSIEEICIKKIDSEDNKYNWSEIANSLLREISSLFLGIGRGIHKKELKIPRNMLWYFFNDNRQINDNKKLTGNEIDSFTDKLLEYLTPRDRDKNIESYQSKELDDKKNIYLPNIEIDTIEAFLNKKYQEAVLDAKEKIEKTLSKTSLNFFNSTVAKEIDLEELRNKLIYNKTLLLEMFSESENIGIKRVFDSLETDEKFLEKLDSSKQTILFNIVKELQSEVELYSEIKLFLDEYNQFLNYDKKLILSANGVYVAPENHSIQKLSSGERHLLTFLATILLMGEEQDFILLDEPEISLDIEWQEKLLSTISKLASNAQIIVVSHSPSIMGNYFDESVEITHE
jgi:energy-coupling factor transporter ATP-binding protein EcfA2